MQQSQHHTTTCWREYKLQWFCFNCSIYPFRLLIYAENETSLKMFLCSMFSRDLSLIRLWLGPTWFKYDFEKTASGLVVRVPARREDQGNNNWQWPPPCSGSCLQLSTVKWLMPSMAQLPSGQHGMSFYYDLRKQGIISPNHDQVFMFFLSRFACVGKTYWHNYVHFKTTGCLVLLVSWVLAFILAW